MSDDHDTTGSSADGGCVVYSGTTTAATNSCDNANALEKARALQLPPVQATLGGEVEHLDFWLDNERLLLEAWNEWSASSSHHHQEEFLPALDEGLVINPDLYRHVHQLWEDEPTMEKEHALHNALWHEPIPGVWVCRNFLTTTGLKHIRQHLQAASSAGIPTRRPNGMNRHGLVIDDETPGGVSYPQLLNFRQWLADIYMRPIARSFFPEYSGSNEPPDDAEAYAFTVHYKVNAHNDAPEEGTLTSVDAKGNTNKNPTANTTTSSSSDIQLPEHSDASIFTLNVNLNLPTNEEDYKGSILEFVVDNDETGTKRKESLRMEPGMAVLHRGMQRHQALPIIEGERHQLIVWLFGAHGYVRFVPYEAHEQRTVQQRWTFPTTTSTRTTTVVAARPSLQQKPRVEEIMQSEL